MRVTISKLNGIQPEIETKLRAHNIKDSKELLQAYHRFGSANRLAEHVGADASHITLLLNRADLARIRGIGEAYTGLLEAAGIQTIKELARRCPEELRAQFERINGERKLVGRVPAQATVNGWVNKARRLPAALD